MKKIIVSLFILFLSEFSFAALHPKYQNMEDLDVMVEFVKNNEKVMSTLTSIDLENFVVYFDIDCKAVFDRKVSAKPRGWVGPADPLEFKMSTCRLN